MPKLMTKLQTFLQRACHELGLAIIIPFSLNVRDGVTINALALLPQLGWSRGMIIVSRLKDLCGVHSELDGLGYGYSVLSEPMAWEEFDIESHVEMFSDWGWNGDLKGKPSWMS